MTFWMFVLLMTALVLGTIFMRRRRLMQEKSNRYTRKKTGKDAKVTPLREPTLGHNPLASHEPETEQQPKAEPTVQTKAPEKEDPDEVLGLKPVKAKQDAPTQKPAVVAKPTEPAIKHLVLHIAASNERPFSGYELLQALLAAGLRYGKMNIFHRHEHKTGRGEVLFSVASTVAPGTFDLPKMGGFSTPGLTLFCSVAKVKEPMKVYELMLSTAAQLAEDLGGRVLNDKRELLTKEHIVSTSKLIRQFEESHFTPDLFEQA